MADEQTRETGAPLDRVALRRALARAAAHRPAHVPAPAPSEPLDTATLLAWSTRLRAMTPPGPQEDSVEILRAIRNE
jgi:hypothetical protein